MEGKKLEAIKREIRPAWKMLVHGLNTRQLFAITVLSLVIDVVTILTPDAFRNYLW